MTGLQKVQMRRGFSDRNKIQEENEIMQFEDFDMRTRISICNEIDNINDVVYRYKGSSALESIINNMLTHVYVEQVRKWYAYDAQRLFDSFLLETIKNDRYDSVLTAIEFYANCVDDMLEFCNTAKSGDRFNEVFEREFVGYRFVQGFITAITDENEIEEIEKATETENEKRQKHFKLALSKLADRDEKDYVNSIKESILAVENICEEITGKDTLGKALKELKNKGVQIPTTLEQGFDKLYGYSSNEGGIRHANAFSNYTPDFADAKFMLVACSAFVNYLTAKAMDAK